MNPLTQSEANTFEQNNCSTCAYFKGRTGAIVQCAEDQKGTKDIFDWKRWQGNTADEWKCKYKFNTK
jgi:hypothetical protein